METALKRQKEKFVVRGWNEIYSVDWSNYKYRWWTKLL